MSDKEMEAKAAKTEKNAKGKTDKSAKAEKPADIKAIKKLNETLLKHEVELEEQVAGLEAKNAELEDRFLRSAAEFDNFKKRTVKEKAAIYTDSVADVIEKFLPLLDNFERAMASFENSDDSTVNSYKEGMDLLFKQVKEIFTKIGVEEIEAEGAAFDPNVHNAVMHIEDEELGDNVVAEVFQKGYRIGDKVIRTSMVKVAN